jgi:hypothetical protein
MNRLVFSIAIASVTVAGLGAVGRRYHAQLSPTVRPLVAVYKITSSRDGKQQPDRYLTLAVRADGTFMTANSRPDVHGQLLTSRAIELKDRYLIVDPLTESVLSYKPYRTLVVATQDCGGTPDTSVLGFATQVGDRQLKTPKGQEEIKRWLAVDLNCVSIREDIVATEDSSQFQLNQEAISIQMGEPPAEYFDVPPSYQERGPADLDKEVSKRFPGKRAFDSQDVIDKLQKVYDATKPK